MTAEPQPKISFPYPVNLPNPILVDTPDVVIGLRGVGATAQAISFILNTVVKTNGYSRDEGKTLTGGRPFHMWHETPDPAALTLRCRWLLAGEPQPQDDTEYLKTWGSGPLRTGSWNSSPEVGGWVGFQLLSYPVPVADLQTFTIEVSWKARGIAAVCRDITGPQLADALAFTAR